MHALCTTSDSGTISEESAILSLPAVTIREAMERPEALDAGSIILTGFDAHTVLDTVGLTIAEHRGRMDMKVPDEYQIPDTSWRVLKLIIDTARLSNKWEGIENIYQS